MTVWVGGAERPVFLEQADLLAQAWAAPLVTVPLRHHFDVIEDLGLPDSDLTRAVLA